MNTSLVPPPVPFSSRLPHGMRLLIRRPGYGIAAWVLLGLAVAANAVAFTMVYGLLLKPLPYQNQARLSIIREQLPAIGQKRSLVSVKTYLRIRRELGKSTEAGLSTWPSGAPASIDGNTQLMAYQRVTPSLFRTLGVRPILGRLPNGNADRPGGVPEAMLSYRFWKSRLGGDRHILGKLLRIGNKSYPVVGVMPRQFFFVLGNVSAWVPLQMTESRTRNGKNINYWMVVRRKDGVSQRKLDVMLENVRGGIMARAMPGRRQYLLQGSYRIDATSVHSAFLKVMGVTHLPWVLQIAAGLLLLLAVINTAHLGLVRQHSRQGEFAISHALGARRLRLVALILAEHLPIAVAVAATATALAWVAVGALHAFGMPPALSPFHVVLSTTPIVITWILTCAVVFVVAMVQLSVVADRKLLQTLGNGPRTSAGRYLRRVQRTLGILQVSLACALLIVSGLLAVSLWRVVSQPVGFRSRDRIAATIFLPPDIDTMDAWRTLEGRLRALPGITGATVTDMLPFSSINHPMDTAYVPGEDGDNSDVRVNDPTVGSGFFKLLKIDFLAGHPFDSAAVANQLPEAVINAPLAKHFFGGAAMAIGRTIDVGKTYRVVGVTKSISWNPIPSQYPFGTAFRPLRAGLREVLIVVLGVQSVTPSLIESVRGAIKRAMPQSAVDKIQPLPQIIVGASIFRSVGVGIVGIFAALAVLVAAFGAFAITAFIARTRLGEYGIRAAIGAGPSALLRLALSEAIWLIAIGMAVGLLCAWLLARVFTGALYHTGTFNAGLYLAGAAIVSAAVIGAAWRPALRAVRTPVSTLIAAKEE